MSYLPGYTHICVFSHKNAKELTRSIHSSHRHYASQTVGCSTHQLSKDIIPFTVTSQFLALCVICQGKWHSLVMYTIGGKECGVHPYIYIGNKKSIFCQPICHNNADRQCKHVQIIPYQTSTCTHSRLPYQLDKQGTGAHTPIHTYKAAYQTHHSTSLGYNPLPACGECHHWDTLMPSNSAHER